MDEIRNQSIKLFSEWLDKQTNFTTSIKIVCGQGFESIYDDYISRFISRRPEPLVRGMEIDIEAFAKEMFEICVYPAPDYWKDQDENTKSRWRTNAEIIRDNAHVWLKEVGG